MIRSLIYLLNRFQPPPPALLPFLNPGSGTALWSVVTTGWSMLTKTPPATPMHTPSFMYEYAHTDHTCTHVLYAFTPAHTTYTEVCMCICIHSHMNLTFTYMSSYTLIHKRFICARKSIHARINSILNCVYVCTRSCTH